MLPAMIGRLQRSRHRSSRRAGAARRAAPSTVSPSRSRRSCAPGGIAGRPGTVVLQREYGPAPTPERNAALADPGSLILFSSCPDPPLGHNQRLPMGAVNNLAKKPSALSPLMKARSAAG